MLFVAGAFHSQTVLTPAENYVYSKNCLTAALPNYQITTYTYNPLIGVTSVTPPSGIRENYIYDNSNRLEKIIDLNNNILKEFKYKYKQ